MNEVHLKSSVARRWRLARACAGMSLSHCRFPFPVSIMARSPGCSAMYSLKLCSGTVVIIIIISNIISTITLTSCSCSAGMANLPLLSVFSPRRSSAHLSCQDFRTMSKYF